MSKYTFHPAESRGHANLGWLNSYHSFSFSNYYRPDRMGFGALRVLSDDTVAADRGFGQHPHDNMEIISIPLSGQLEHKDSMNTVATIKEGDIQVMSAGTGITHSEYNKSADEEVKFLQIWVVPKKKQVTPRYDQITLDPQERLNKFQQILSPDADGGGVWIHQDAWFNLAKFDTETSLTYSIHKAGNGIYAFALSGNLMIDKQEMKSRDGLAISDVNEISIVAQAGSEILLMEVPL